MRTMSSAAFLGLASLLLAGAASAQQDDPGLELPASFQHARVFVHPVTADGDTLRLYTDTGGSLYFYRDAADRLGLPARDTVVRGRSYGVTSFPEVADPPGFPWVPGASPLLRPRDRIHRIAHPEADGLLGQAWFRHRVWTIDYREEELVLHRSGEAPALAAEHTVELGFPTDSAGRRRTGYASVEATIAGETRPFLLDTGATLILSEAGREALGGPRVRAGSYVVASVFERWREEHPEWRVVEEGSIYGGGAPLVRVPEVTIAGHTVGPVWFARRPDANFRRRMASMMDRPVDGALGGSLFRHFELTLDYPGGRAHFGQGGSEEPAATR